MKLYITKPKHYRYGRIMLDNPYETIDDLVNDSIVWFIKPYFEKPFLDFFLTKILVGVAGKIL